MDNWKRTSITDQASGPRTCGKNSKSYVRSTVTDAKDSATLEQSVPDATKKKVKAEPEQIRNNINESRDGRVNLGGKASDVVTK